jgi:hypothetical protein
MMRLTLAILAGSITSSAFASASDQGFTSQILTTSDGRAFFEQSGTRTTRPACATLTRWAFDSTTATGQAMMANLLTSNAQGRKVYISGSGNCSAWGDSETVGGIQLAN